MVTVGGGLVSVNVGTIGARVTVWLVLGLLLGLG